MSKVGIIGAGNVGGMSAVWIAGLGLADVVLIDKGSGRAEGKAMDINDALAILGSDRWVEGGSDYSLLKGADVVVITAGFPRKPGMSREDLLRANVDIIEEVLENAKPQVSPDCVWIFVTNPLDVITAVGYKRLGVDRHKVIGMGVNLDSSRMVNQVSALTGVARSSISAMVIGRHGQGMIPLVESVSLSGVPFSLPKDVGEEVRERTVNRGAEIVKAFGTGSAYVAPGAGVFQVVRALLSGEGHVLPLSVWLEGEYGIEEGCVGVPVKVSYLAWEEVVEVDLTQETLQALREGASGVISALKSLGL